MDRRDVQKKNDSPLHDRRTLFDGKDLNISMGYLLLSFCLLLAWDSCFDFSPSTAWAAGLRQGEEVSVDGDRLYFDQERELYVAEGDVQFVSGDMKLTCDYVEYSDQSGDFFAEGNVTYTGEEGIIYCDRVEGNVLTRLGAFYAVEMDNVKGGYLLKGDKVEKVGDETFRVDRGSISQCGKTWPLWVMRGKNMQIAQNQYVSSKHTSLWLAGIPIFYAPYFILPIKSQRQSGFLPPVYGSGGRNGNTIGLDYYWAIDSNRDATFSYAYLEDNGNRFGLEYRYAVNQTVRGSLFGYYIHDRNADRDGSRVDMNQDRWEIGMTHSHNLQDKVYGGLFADVYSDGYYLTDFSRSSEARVQNNGQSDLVVVDRWDSGNLSMDFRYYQEMNVRRERTTLQSLPELRLDLTPNRIRKSSWFYSLDSSIVSFYRQEEYDATFSSQISSDPLILNPVTPEQNNNLQQLTDAGFDSETALRHQGIKGRRLDLFPEISLPLDLTHFMVFTPRAGYREILYSRDAFSDDSVDRGVFNTGFDVTARAHGDFSVGSSRSLRHILEPEISYDYRKDTDEKEVPIFDEIDRMEQVDEFHLKLTNRFLLTDIDNMDRREIVTMKLDALYNRLLSTQKFRSITGELDLNFTDNLYIEVKSMYDFLTHDFEELNLDLKFSINDALKFQAGRRFTNRVPVDPNLPIGQGESRTLGGDVTLQGIENDGISFWTASFNWEPTPEISMNLSGYFNAKEDDGDDITFQLAYERECWGVMVTLERYDDTVINENTQALDIDTVNEIHFFFTIKSLHLKLFSQEPD